MTKKFIIGIDEVGRGPVAGPVSIGIAIIPAGYDLLAHFKGLNDSKRMTVLARERVHARAVEFRNQGILNFGVFSVPADFIDASGIERAIATAIARGLAELAPDPSGVELFLDGRLKAPEKYTQEAIIRGDSLVPAISLASVVAKVERDSYMSMTAHAKYPVYGFDSHKGYGTEAHMEAIRAHGLTPLHRTTFLKSLMLE